MTKGFKFVGKVSVFGLRAIRRSFRPPFELQSLRDEIEEVGSRSISLVVASGFALGVVMTLHTRSTLVMFGAAAMIPRVQSLAFLVEIGPLFAGLLIAGRVGAGIGAVVANMSASGPVIPLEVGRSFRCDLGRDWVVMWATFLVSPSALLRIHPFCFSQHIGLLLQSAKVRGHKKGDCRTYGHYGRGNKITPDAGDEGIVQFPRRAGSQIIEGLTSSCRSTDQLEETGI